MLSMRNDIACPTLVVRHALQTASVVVTCTQDGNRSCHTLPAGTTAAASRNKCSGTAEPSDDPWKEKQKLKPRLRFALASQKHESLTAQEFPPPSAHPLSLRLTAADSPAFGPFPEKTSWPSGSGGGSGPLFGVQGSGFRT